MFEIGLREQVEKPSNLAEGYPINIPMTIHIETPILAPMKISIAIPTGMHSNFTLPQSSTLAVGYCGRN